MVRLDGNSIGGILESVFGRDLTVAVGICRGCGAERHIGALHVYRAAGIVVRCPDCELVLMRVVESPQRTWIDLQGFATMQIPAD
jgi:Family of unknown function (DUF6510)